ncbi:hypothetical protein AVEN_242886-1, partial [Araneus ventricosus]
IISKTAHIEFLIFPVQNRHCMCPQWASPLESTSGIFNDHYVIPRSSYALGCPFVERSSVEFLDSTNIISRPSEAVNGGGMLLLVAE